MNQSRPAFRNLHTGKVVDARPAITSGLGPTAMTWFPDVPGDLNRTEWMPGTIDAAGKFHPWDHSVSYILKFPEETTAELDQLIKETGGDATELFKKAIGLYKLARDAVHEGKAVGVASSPDCLETEFVGI